MKTRFLSHCLLLPMVSNLVAQQPKESEPLPEPPFVAPMPERLQWSMTVKPVGGEATDAPQPPAISPWALRRVDSTKTGIYKHDVETYQNGQKREYWFVGGMMLDMDSSKKNVWVVDYKAIQGQLPSSVGEPQTMSGWEVFSWINLGKYKDHVSVGKEPCYHYVLNENSKETAEAWISAQTKYPLVYRCNNQVYLFQYGPPPADLQLPPEYEKTWKQYQQRLERIQKIKNSGDR